MKQQLLEIWQIIYAVIFLFGFIPALVISLFAGGPVGFLITGCVILVIGKILYPFEEKKSYNAPANRNSFF